MEKINFNLKDHFLDILIAVFAIFAIIAYNLGGIKLFRITGLICAVLLIAELLSDLMNKKRGKGIWEVHCMTFVFFIIILLFLVKGFLNAVVMGLSVGGLYIALLNTITFLVNSKSTPVTIEEKEEDVVVVPEAVEKEIKPASVIEEPLLLDANVDTVSRVKTMEKAFGLVSGAISKLQEDTDVIGKLKGTVSELDKYLSSGLWKKDFEADERGEIPIEVKRGVLSEDGLYNLLEEYGSIAKSLFPKEEEKAHEDSGTSSWTQSITG
ncbi:MAG: DUF4298 domain-containing protein [Bacteroidales bacterium]|nr:DUF4298 domain-containing protein [Bacteroidales bacterium]